MNIIVKILRRGLKEGLLALKRRLNRQINYVAYYIFSLLPIATNRVLFESEGDFTDNAYALFSYMQKKGYFDKYEAIWLADNPFELNSKGVKAVSKKGEEIHLLTSYYLATCKYYIYDHNNLFNAVKKRKEQRIIYLSHGCAFKRSKGSTPKKAKTNFDEVIVTGDFPAIGICNFWKCDIKKVFILGYPRLDFFQSDLSITKSTLNKHFRFDIYTKIILWMPTFRQSHNKSLSEDYIRNETGLPLFSTKSSLCKFNQFLKENNYLTILKIHHLQAELPVFESNLDNIMFLKDEDLKSINIQLYQFIAITDMLITDYSSISIDYMLLNKSMVFILDDYNEYKNSRGIWPANAIDYMPGYHVYNVDELVTAIMEIGQGKDTYAKMRREVLPKMHKFVDGNSSQRIIEHIGFEK